jgi:hypothetical protein
VAARCSQFPCLAFFSTVALSRSDDPFTTSNLSIIDLKHKRAYFKAGERLSPCTCRLAPVALHLRGPRDPSFSA